MKDDKAANDNGTHQTMFKNDVSSSAQRVQILSYLKKHGSATTLEIRDKLHILSPAPRILELRGQGVEIETVREYQPTPDGKKHHIARYVLRSSIAA